MRRLVDDSAAIEPRICCRSPATNVEHTLMATVIEVKCSIPYALRNEGAAAIGEDNLRRLAADRIENLERLCRLALANIYGVADGTDLPSIVVRDQLRAALLD